MADKDKLEINFRDLAKNAAQYVFSSTFPSLERMLKTIQTTGEENREQVENLSSSFESVSIRLTEINTGLRKLNEAMTKSLGILGKLLRKQDGGDAARGDASPAGGFGNIAKGATAVAGFGGMMQIIDNQYSAPGPETPVQGANTNAPSVQPATPLVADATPVAAPPAGATAPAAPTTPAATVAPEKKQDTAASAGKTLLIKASTITFDAGQIIFTSGGGASSSGGGGASSGGSVAPSSGGGGSSSGSSQTSATPSQGGGQQASIGGGGQFNPAEGAGGENGRLDTSQLTRIPGGRLQSAAAGPYMEMVKAAREDNISWGVTDSYRDYPSQVKVAREKGLYSQGGLAATPGRSNHGWGTALDLDFKPNPKASNWLQQNAGRFGFSTIPREAWHWEYNGGGQTGGTMTAKADQSKVSGEGAPGGGAAKASASAPSASPKTGPSAPLGASPAMPAPSPKPEEKKTASAAAPVASPPTKGAELNKESTSSEVASVTPPARASMSNIKAGGGEQKESDIPTNPKITDSNKAGSVEPDDAAQRYESLFGMKPRVPTGSTAKVA
jgi:hypothetical protein